MKSYNDKNGCYACCGHTATMQPTDATSSKNIHAHPPTQCTALKYGWAATLNEQRNCRASGLGVHHFRKVRAQSTSLLHTYMNVTTVIITWSRTTTKKAVTPAAGTLPPCSPPMQLAQKIYMPTHPPNAQH